MTLLEVQEEAEVTPDHVVGLQDSREEDQEPDRGADRKATLVIVQEVVPSHQQRASQDQVHAPHVDRLVGPRNVLHLVDRPNVPDPGLLLVHSSILIATSG